MIFIEHASRIDDWLAALLAAIAGTVLVFDRTFKIAKKIAGETGGRIFAALFGMINEFHQWKGVFVCDTQMETVRQFFVFCK